MATFTDDFNRADSTNIGNWTEITDNWSISSNQLAPGVSVTGVALYASPVSTTDHYAEITLSNASSSSMGVFARSDVGGNNFYLWRNDGAEWTLFHNIGGNFTSIGSYTAAAANGDVAKIQCQGSTIKGFVNGVERVSVTDTNITTGNYGGVRCAASSTARFDNFTVSDLGGGPVIHTGAFFQFIQPI